nr:hypothetical protein [uncultured Blautia sp.]
MKKIRKILAAVLVLMLMLTPVVSVSQPVAVQAAAKTTLKKSGGRYYAYENGRKLRNTWRTIKSGKKKYTYYFGSNGAAYRASKEMMGRYGVIVKKIKGQYYGFDYLGHRVKGVRVGSTSTYGMPYVFYFNSNGTYNKKKTAQLRTASKTNKKAATIKKMLGKCKKTRVSKNSCFMNGNGSDITYIYDTVELSVFRPKGKSYKYDIVESLVARY